MRYLSFSELSNQNGGAIFSEKWCDENNQKINDVAFASLLIGAIPFLATQIYAGLVGGTMTIIGFACSH